MTPAKITELCERFARNKDTYHSAAYNEAQLRQEFLNPMFAELGWDMENRQGFAEAYKDVVHEDSIRVEESMKAPDYAFRIGGTRKFFLEAKKPMVFIKDDRTPAYQLRRYAWSAKLPLSILTNFEEFAVYDCRWRPAQDDKAGMHRIKYLRFEEYGDKWEEIAAVFSREAILKGSFDKYAAEARGKRGTQEVDDEFLKDLEVIREDLARNLYLRNRGISLPELNYAVGKIIDRVLFLRVCEDRGIEEYGRISQLLKGDRVYARLNSIFVAADERYNSGLFHFQKEKGRNEEPDTLTPKLAVDDRLLKELIKRLYYPESPYEFSVMRADILGQVYEQFLGKVIIKSGRTVDVEYKPEVKKAGGVYYTPTYIVDYIVKHTVGKLLEGKTPEEVSKLRVLDPACGSGSFLIGAYQYLLDWHLDYYKQAVAPDGSPLGVAEYPSACHPERSEGSQQVKQGEILQTEDGLQNDKMREGGLQNDRKRSVASAALRKSDTAKKSARSAALRTLYQSARGDWRLTLAERKRILLNNIYGVDIDAQAVEVTKLSLLLKVLEGESEATIQGELKLRHHALPDLGKNIKCGNSLIGPDIRSMFPDLSGEEIARINPFDWEREFPEVFKAGGFDAVVGNPPYGAEFGLSASQYLKERFSTFVWRGESYLVFVEKASRILRREGFFGYIIPDTYLNLGFTKPLRNLLLDRTIITEIVTLPSTVFSGATVDTTLLFFVMRQEFAFLPSLVSVKLFKKRQIIASLGDPDQILTINSESWSNSGAFNVQASPKETELITKVDQFVKLDTLAEMFYGIKVYQVGKGKPPQTAKIRDEKPFTSSKKLDKSFQPMFDGKHIARYTVSWNKSNWVKYGPWLAEPRTPEKYEGEKILIRKIVGRTLIASYFPDTSYCNTLLFTLKLRLNAGVSYAFILGVINSAFIAWYYRKKFQISNEDTFPQIMIRDILQFPIPKADKARHDKMVKLVERMLELNKQLPEVKVPGEKEKLERQIAATDREIDLLVYELYCLTEDEIKIVEEGTKR